MDVTKEYTYDQYIVANTLKCPTYYLVNEFKVNLNVTYLEC